PRPDFPHASGHDQQQRREDHGPQRLRRGRYVWPPKTCCTVKTLPMSSFERLEPKRSEKETSNEAPAKARGAILGMSGGRPAEDHQRSNDDAEASYFQVH